MPVPSFIKDPQSGSVAKVTEFGQLVTAPIDYSVPVVDTLAADNTPVNFIEPQGGKKIVITDIILTANRDVGVNGALVQVYCATAPDSSAITVGLLDIDMLKNTGRDLIGVNFIIDEGFWVNAISDDSSIQITLGF